jgi:thiol-disulfide isomerase/thioredoxin
MTVSIVRRCAGAWLVFAIATVPLQAGPLPRYDLKPGQVLTYEQIVTLRGQGESSRQKWTWRLWVVGRNVDGSSRIVARTAIATVQPEGSAAPAERVTFARFDIRPDGGVPPCPKQATAGWESRDERDDLTTQYTPIVGKDTQDAAVFDFEADRRSYSERIYGGRDHRTFHFDCKRGVIARGQIAQAYGSHADSTSDGTLELTSITEMAPTELAAFGAQMDCYFNAHQEYLAIYRRVEKSGDRADALLIQGRKLLADARANVTLPEPSAALDAQIKNHDHFAASKVDDAVRFAKIVGHPAPAWEIKDLNGRTHSLEQYRGKVLVLDFWYRGCGWCMRAMPQVKRVAAHYRSRPVAVFAINNDQKEDDARFVEREMKLDYPVLRSLDLPQQYGIQGFPTLIIIDQHGKVADIHVGYSPQLFENIAATVDRLLDEK